MKLRVLILTFVSYAFLHALRTGYSFSKAYFKIEYELSNTFLAVLDSSIYFAMGLGFFFRYFFFNSKNIVSSLFITGMIFISSFTLFLLLSITNVITSGNAEVISLILLIIYGFFQMNCWPVSLQLLNDYYTNDSEGSIIGFWAEGSSFGNIIGFLYLLY
jgi:OPA family glycerol-3-phosphate transporter-like MFS transporter 3